MITEKFAFEVEGKDLAKMHKEQILVCEFCHACFSRAGERFSDREATFYDVRSSQALNTAK